jgi:hypothetical protein
MLDEEGRKHLRGRKVAAEARSKENSFKLGMFNI